MTRIAIALSITFAAITALGSWWAIDVYASISCPMGADCYSTPEWGPSIRFGVIAGGIAALVVLAVWAALRRYRSTR
ncbi:MAG TPA: hypothetical protein VES36_09255 [Candidatus Limnocylindrales bacterium]|nr:hypothetical protein [Candidatus Limnocylindrales bacterium]